MSTSPRLGMFSATCRMMRRMSVFSRGSDTWSALVTASMCFCELRGGIDSRTSESNVMRPHESCCLTVRYARHAAAVAT